MSEVPQRPQQGGADNAHDDDRLAADAVGVGAPERLGDEHGKGGQGHHEARPVFRLLEGEPDVVLQEDRQERHRERPLEEDEEHRQPEAVERPPPVRTIAR